MCLRPRAASWISVLVKPEAGTAGGDKPSVRLRPALACSGMHSPFYSLPLFLKKKALT